MPKVVIKSPWWYARKERLYTSNILTGKKHLLDKDVNYFVKKLWSKGIKTVLSCGGHGNPNEFYIIFDCPLKKARNIAKYGYFVIELSNLLWSDKFYRLSLHYRGEEEKRRLLALASLAWENEEIID